MDSIKTRHTITVSEYTFRKLRGAGMFGESYSDLILRLVESVNGKLDGNIGK
jgi:predicted CopG family antitoxin